MIWKSSQPSLWAHKCHFAVVIQYYYWIFLQQSKIESKYIHTFMYAIIIISFVPDQLNLALGREAFVNRPNVILFHSAAPFWLPIFGYWGHYCTRSVYIMYPGPSECMRTWEPVLAIFWVTYIFRSRGRRLCPPNRLVLTKSFYIPTDLL